MSTVVIMYVIVRTTRTLDGLADGVKTIIVIEQVYYHHQMEQKQEQKQNCHTNLNRCQQPSLSLLLLLLISYSSIPIGLTNDRMNAERITDSPYCSLIDLASRQVLHK